LQLPLDGLTLHDATLILDFQGRVRAMKRFLFLVDVVVYKEQQKGFRRFSSSLPFPLKAFSLPCLSKAFSGDVFCAVALFQQNKNTQTHPHLD